MQPTTRSRPHRLLLAVVLAVSLAACGNDGELLEEVEALRVAAADRAVDQAELVDRVEELEEQLGELTAPPEDADGDEVEDPLDVLRGDLDALEDQLTALDASAATTDEATAAARSAAESAASDLRGTLDQVRGATEELRGEIEELRTRFDALQARMDRHDREGH